MEEVRVAGETVGTYLRRQREIEGAKPTACGTSLRGSEAYGCARKIALRIGGIPEAHEPNNETLLAFKLGNTMHELLQDSMHSLWSDFESEVVVDLRPLGFDMSGHADGLYSIGDKQMVLEIKTQSSFGFKLALKANKPKIEHVCQAAIYAAGLGADAVHLVYICKEGSYRDGVKPGQMLEWRYDLTDDFDGQTVEQIAMAELWRQQEIVDGVKDGRIPLRSCWDDKVNEFVVVDSPPPYQGKGQPWNCRYCEHRDNCAPLPTHEVSVALATPFIKHHWGGVDVAVEQEEGTQSGA